MGQDGCAGAANILGHTDFRTIDLCPVTFAAQLLGNLHDLIHPCCANWMSARF